MRSTVHKLYFVWDFERQEKWLNEMAAKGLNLVGVGFCSYVFEEGVPGEWQYHLEWLKHFPGHPESIAYIRFLEETGAEHVGTFKKWVYFRKRAAEGAFDLFSDLDSRIAHFGRIMRLICLLGASLLCYVVALISSVLGSEYFSGAFVAMLGIYAAFIGLFGVGFYRALRAYRKLKKLRMIQE